MRPNAFATACTALVSVVASLSAPSAPAAKLTRSCNTSLENVLEMDGLSATSQAAILGAVAHPESNPALFESLWEPRAAQAYYFPSTSGPGGTYDVILTMDPFQDTVEMAAAMATDAALAALGVAQVHPTSLSTCFATLPGIQTLAITEYHNTILDHYFLSSTDAENASIDSGGAGPGWERTGQAFGAIVPESCRGFHAVFRFYSPKAHSHFFTVDPAECGFVRAHDANWIAEGVAFGAMSPTAGACPAWSSTTPVYRLYNRREAFDDQNHRFTTSLATYQQMMDRGWAGEGVTMCIRAGN